MTSFVDELIKKDIPWLKSNSGSSPIAVSSRVRFARNVMGYNFPPKLTEENRNAVHEIVIHAAESCEGFENAYCSQMNALEEFAREVLLERHLVSASQMVTTESGRGVVISRDESFSIMVNEDDHVRLQGLGPGLQLREIHSRLLKIDEAMDKTLHYSYRDDIGYLSSSPMNVGTGMRASVMLHLPGLVYMKQIDQVMNALSKMGIIVRGIFGEGSTALGNLFQISNNSTLGESEAQIVDRLTKVVNQVIIHEENARQTLLTVNETFTYDLIGRAYGVLKHAYLLDTQEALSKLSALRLGVDLGVFAFLTMEKVNELFIATQPGHLQMYAQKSLSPADCDIFRANLVRNKLSGMGLELD